MELLYVDMSGPWKIRGLKKSQTVKSSDADHQAQYVLIILDDYTGHVWVRFLSGRDSIKRMMADFIRRENGRRKFKRHDGIEVFVKVQRLRLDGAKENLCGEI